ncbi:unnamed protein product [Cochlearia groenlandica]
MKSCQEKARDMLLQGHGCANQLKVIMNLDESDSSMKSEDLAKSVLHCFSDALSILIETNDDDDDHQDVQSNNSSPYKDSSTVLERTSKPLHKRGRKTSMVESAEYRRHESTKPIYHDGFLWRKYGQKQIKESDHQRSYYKCAYTKEENCEAKKQVQMIQNNPPLYSTTYLGYHTCQLRNHQAYATFPSENSHQDSHMIRFDHPNSFTHYQNQNQNYLKNEYMSPHDGKAEESSSSQWMSSEVAHALEAFEFNPFRTSSHLS